jgi:peptidoglycan/xylan/chitin deacetylase (PgdA/CDA1 family)
MSFTGNKLYGLNNRVNNFLIKRFYKKTIQIGNSADSDHYISFTFDDFAKSASTEALDVLNSYNIKATYYVSFLNRDRVIYEKKMYSNDDLNRIYENGHELGCHTYNHLDCKSSYFISVKNSIDKNILSFREILPGIRFSSFSFPYGRYNFLSKKIVYHQFNTGRTTKGGVNHGTVDVHLLKANKLYSKSVPLQKIYDLIDLNKKQKGWLIFYTHDVEKNPSEFGCDPDYFDNIVKYATQSKAEILPINDVLLKLS